MEQQRVTRYKYIEHDGHKFYSYKYIDIELITYDMLYFNISELIRFLGFESMKDIFKFSLWKSYEYFITKFKVDDSGFINISYDLNDENAWINGEYINVTVLNFILMKSDSVNIFKIGRILDKIHYDMFEECAKSKMGMNHDQPGSILLKQSNFVNNAYKCWHNEIETLLETDPDVYVINNVYNPKETLRELNFYVKCNRFENITWRKNNIIQFEDINDVKNAINQIQTFQVSVPSIEEMIYSCKNTYEIGSKNFVAMMFEIYCAERFNYTIYKYAKTEYLSLSKIDKGVDLLDLNNRRMGQCKFYQESTLSNSLLKSFKNFCLNYPTYQHILYVNDNIKLTSEFDNDLFDIEFVDRHDFFEWYHEKTDDVLKYIIYEERVENARKWLRMMLETNETLIYNDIETYINNTFNLDIKSSITFNKLFGDMYMHKPNEGLPSINGNKVLKSKPEHKEDEEKFIIEYIKYGYYLKTEVCEAFNVHFKTDVSYKYITKKYNYLWMQDRQHRKQRRNYNHECVEVLELKDEIVPEKGNIFKEFITSMNGDTLEHIITEFNQEFHRQETIMSMKMILERLDINISVKEVVKEKVHIERLPRVLRQPTVITWQRTPENIRRAREWLKNELETHECILYDDAIEYINNNFDLRINTTYAFGKYLSGLYKTNHQTGILEDATGSKILVKRPSLEEAKQNKSIEREFIIKFIDLGEYLKEEFIDAFNVQFGTNYTDMKIISKRHYDLFKRENAKHKHRRRINGDNIEVLELRDDVVPGKIETLKEYARRPNMTRDEFNEHFHRFESALTFNKLLSE